MRSLCTEDILRIWEAGQHQGPVDRALSSIAPAFPEVSRDELAEMSLGRRNRLLLAVREGLFGPTLRAYAECSACNERLEFAMDGRRLLGDESREAVEEVSVHSGGIRLRLRALSSADLAAAQDYESTESARMMLLTRSLLEAVNEAALAEPESANGLRLADLPAGVVAEMEDKLAEADPNAELVVSLGCPACQNECHMPLDIASFFWTEISAEAKRLIREVGQLARAFGWREQDILGMSSSRRQAYLETISQ
jgi:hypothetical protein